MALLKDSSYHRKPSSESRLTLSSANSQFEIRTFGRSDVLRLVSSAVIILFWRWMRCKCLSGRCDVTRGLQLRVLLFLLSVCRRRISNLEMVILDTLKWSATAWTIPIARSRSLWRSRGIEVLVKIIILRMANWLPLLTAQLMTTGDLNA